MASYAQTVKNYTINTTAKTITFTDFTSVILERLALITDVTTGAILYQFNSASVTASVSGNVLTLSAMAGVSNTDKLRIDYTTTTGDPTYETPALPLGAATAAAQVAGNSNIAAVATNTANIPAKGAASTANSTPVNIASDQIVATRGGFAEIAGLTAAAVNADLFPSIDVSAYKAITLQVLGTWVGTLTFQASNDNATFVTTYVYDLVGRSGTPTAGSNSIYRIPVSTRYVRVRMTSYTSGTATAVAELFSTPPLVNGDQILVSGGSIGLNGGSNAIGAVTPQPLATSTGLTSFFAAALAATPTAVKASSGRWHNYNVYNPNTSVAYLQLFDLATGSVTLGTTSPKQSFCIPAGGVWDGALIHSLSFATAITIAATTTPTGSAAPATGLVVNLGVI